MSHEDDPVVKFIVKKSYDFFNEPKIYLFGSRAKKSNSERSDYDFAIDTNGAQFGVWARFLSEVEEGAPTLLKLDLIKLDSQISEELLGEIAKTRIALH